MIGDGWEVQIGDLWNHQGFIFLVIEFVPNAQVQFGLHARVVCLTPGWAELIYLSFNSWASYELLARI